MVDKNLPLRFYNTEKREKELFQPSDTKNVKIYTCGPTVYHFAHIGNFRTYVFEDLLRRTLKFFDYQVTQVMNITDVDDKTIRGATESNVSLADYIQPYKNAFFVDLNDLGIEKVEHYPCATDYIHHMIDFIQKLIDKGHAYQSSKDKSVYFAIDKCPRYGRLSHLKLSELKIGASDADEYDKENIGDFVLWKAYNEERDGSVYWESPFGPGRPGWHLECSAMAMNLLGETIDLHCGAVDNIFPHHENEIAQSECLSGQCFVRHWLHSEHLIVNGKKMSKSLGNFYTLRDLLKKGYSGTEVRYMLLHTHYRTQLNFTFEGMEGAKHSLERLNGFTKRVQEIADSKIVPSHSISTEEAHSKFCQALADDLNISVALSVIFDLMREVNVGLDKGNLNGGDAYEVLCLLEQFNRVLGVLNFEQEEGPPRYLIEMLEKREQARKDKDWELSDKLRNEIHASGYLIEDTPQGVRLKKH
ncbi:MAG: Cysteine--tRNA ligase [Chlamydiales bacterium]|nr:Cysteine--tRNA ligase [Chlamydiales bacterium]MCH9619890.1 Cysteine--tRNA ligase [Chlamydiales bacterium]MCH9622683.1 Cysteine--tRNA ligase [Chlamydiales bacterium]